jgi:hypothetical protein
MRVSWLGRGAAVVLAVVGGAFASPAAAQVGSTTDIISGRVTNPQGQPVEGATVTATSLETRTSRSRTTNAKGQYTILFPDGGGTYRLTIRSVGFDPQVVTVGRQADEDRIVADVKLGAAAAQQLSAVRVQGNRGGGGNDQQQGAGVGGQERSISTDLAARLPVEQSDLNALAALAPGVLSVTGSDSTPGSFAVAGQRPTQNNTTLDGISFGSAQVPQEAVRNTRVITNTYDVGRGQFTGGQIASTTRSGTNVFQGSGTYNVRPSALQWLPNVPGAFGRGSTTNQLSLGFGGPLVKEKAFYFIAGQLRLNESPLQTLLSADPLSLQRLGTTQDSVVRFLEQLERLGIDPTVANLPTARSNDNSSIIARFDVNLSDEHTLTVRGDASFTSANASSIGATSVPSAGGDQRGTGGGVFTALTSRFGNGMINELRARGSRNDNASNRFVDYPGGRVRVGALLDDGTVGFTTYGFGANPGLPREQFGEEFEGTNELSWLTPNHRFKLGLLANLQRNASLAAFNTAGTYTYNSLGEFLGGTPALFTRTLNPRQPESSRLNAAIYLGDTWRKSREFQLTYGLRAEGSRYTGAPGRNAAVDSVFGLRTDVFPTEVALMPRVGFSYIKFGEPGTGPGAGPLFFVRGGVGDFRGTAPANLFTTAQQASGLATGEAQLVCAGPGVPIPNWEQYLSGVGIPTQCAGGVAPVLAQSAPAVTAFAPDFVAPRTLRGSLGVTKRFWQRWTANVDMQYAAGRALYGVADRNLRLVPQFTLAGEGNRPVYVPAQAIATTTGVAPLAASRVDPRFGNVFELSSGFRSTNWQVVSALNAFTNRGMVINFSYTYAQNRDQSSFSFGPPALGFSQTTTDGDPNRLEWARSDLDRRHNFIGTFTWPVRPSMELTFVSRLTSGAPYTPLVGTDVNGDGSRNDRAFIFDPAAPGTDPTVAQALRTILAESPRAARECLTSQLGRVAGRNSCNGPWVPSFDLQVNYRPDRVGLKRRLALSLSLQNTLAGVDQLLHGENLRGWGQQARPDNTLFFVRGFDAATRAYRYEVNERFGNVRGAAQAFRAPFTIALQARFTLGSSQAGDRFGGFGGGGGPFGGGGFGGGGGPPGGQGGAPGGGFAAIFGGGAAGGGGAPGAGGAAGRAAAFNPFQQTLNLADSLALTREQIGTLKQLADTADAAAAAFAKELQETVKKAGNNPDPSAVFALIRPKLEEGRTRSAAQVEKLKAVLTAEQWAKLPERVKNPPFAGPGGGGQRRPPGR